MFEWLADPAWGGIGTIVSIVVGLVGVCSWVRNKRKKATAALPRELPGPKALEQNDAHDLVRRFVEIYTAHGIERTQIPRLLGEEFGLTLNDVSTDEKLLAVLNEAILTKTCEIFGVRREWLDGKDVPIYPYIWFYKNLSAFIDFLADLKQQHEEVQLFLIKCPEDKLRKYDDRWPIEVLIRVKIEHWGHFSEDSIWRYYPLSNTYYNWGYERTRLHLKAMTLIAWQLGIHIGGCQLPKKDMEAIIEGSVFPGPLFEPLHHVAWHPDDYIFANGESCAVADHEEALEVRKFLAKQGWMEKLIDLTGPLKLPLSDNSLNSKELFEPNC